MPVGEQRLRSRSRGFHALAALIVLAGLYVRVADPILAPVTLRDGRGGMADSVTYLLLAGNLAAGNGFSVDPQPPYRSYTTRAPLYPAFLASILLVAGEDYVAIRVVQGLLGVATAALGFLAFAKLRPRFHAASGLAVLALLFLDPSIHLLDGEILSESLAAFFMTAAVFAAVRAGPRPAGLAAAGLCLGLLMLTRPEHLFFPVALALVLAILRAPRWKLLLPCLLVASALVILPWSIRNYRASERLIPISDGVLGCGVLLGLAWTPDNFAGWGVFEPESFSSEEASKQATRLWHRYFFHFNRDSNAVREADRAMLTLAVSEYRKRPELLPRRAAEHVLSLWRIQPIRLHNLDPPGVFSWGLLILGIGGLLLGNPRERLPRTILFLPALYVTAVVVPFLADWRYAVPALPSLVALSGLALEDAIRHSADKFPSKGI
jgi:4-amino-4-deoxy-L-arabinose transferase-like glycosyltransferase